MVDEVCASGKHLREMRQCMLYDRDRAMSHIFDMPIERCVPSATTLRSTTTLRGCAAGMVLPAPGGASHASGMMRQSVLEEVLLLDFHTVLGQKLTVLLGKCLTTMVLFLPSDIAHYHVFVAQTIRKARILLRPSVEKREMRVGFEPLAGRDFDFLNKLGHRQGRWQGHEKMYVVGHATDAVESASDIVDKTKHVGIEFSLMFFSNGRDAAMGTEDNMIECLRVTHAILTMNNTDYCNTSPRRGDTHYVQLTPYKPIGAVWWSHIQAKRRVVVTHTSEAPCGGHTYKRSAVW